MMYLSGTYYHVYDAKAKLHWKNETLTQVRFVSPFPFCFAF